MDMHVRAQTLQWPVHAQGMSPGHPEFPSGLIGPSCNCQVLQCPSVTKFCGSLVKPGSTRLLNTKLYETNLVEYTSNSTLQCTPIMLEAANLHDMQVLEEGADQ